VNKHEANAVCSLAAICFKIENLRICSSAEAGIVLKFKNKPHVLVYCSYKSVFEIHLIVLVSEVVLLPGELFPVVSISSI